MRFRPLQPWLAYLQARCRRDAVGPLWAGPQPPLDGLVETRHLPSPLDSLIEVAMARAEKTTLLQGTLDLIVLQLLQAEPTNGYELSLRIQAISKDVLTVNAGSLYPALYRLEARELISAEWASTEKGRRAKDYSPTPHARKALASERETL